MSTFWIVATLLPGIAVLFVLIPLLRSGASPPGEREAGLDRTLRRDRLRELEADVASGTLDPEALEEARIELERRLLQEAEHAPPPQVARASRGRTALALGVAVPLFATLLYASLGRPDAVLPAVERPGGAAHPLDPKDLRAMVQTLADRLQASPDDGTGWIMLGRSYTVLGEHSKAAAAYARAETIVGEEPDVLSAHADSLAMSQGGRFDATARSLVDRALRADPSHPRSLWLAGTIAFEDGDYRKALGLWQRLAALAPAGSTLATAMAANIDEARRLLGESSSAGARAAASAPAPRTPGAQASEKPAPSAAQPAMIEGRVRIDSALAERLDPQATVFIFARALEGPRMPLAILRRKASELPLSFHLDSTQAMMPQASLARFERVRVGARISRSGNAMPQSGDLEGASGPVAVGSRDVEIVIDRVVP
ncbi:MAG: c-type cytochrome biogenesis protein CcmI [Myxococcota bacterium]